MAGSGKTLILGYRSEVLADLLNKPVLVLCFNITLAAKLRSHMTKKGISDKVHVYHFHDWCGEQLRTYHVNVDDGENPYWERQVDSVINGVGKGQIPCEQYGALLIDEGHDFEEDWLRLVVQMIDRNTNSLLLLYDDAQSIYRQNGLGFTLSSVGVQARGRTKILKLNYRNTREILAFAYEFARDYLQEKGSSDDQVPLIKPETAGVGGPAPIFRQFRSFQEEAGFAANCATKWHEGGVALARHRDHLLRALDGRNPGTKVQPARNPSAIAGHVFEEEAVRPTGRAGRDPDAAEQQGIGVSPRDRRGVGES